MKALEWMSTYPKLRLKMPELTSSKWRLVMTGHSQSSTPTTPLLSPLTTSRCHWKNCKSYKSLNNLKKALSKHLRVLLQAREKKQLCFQTKLWLLLLFPRFQGSHPNKGGRESRRSESKQKRSATLFQECPKTS